MAEELNIYQKLAKIRKQVEVIQKNKRGYGYTYVSEDEILARVSVLMDKYHLSLIPRILDGTTKVEPYTYKKTKATKNGEIYEENCNEVLVYADMIFTWINNEDPEETVVVPWMLVGQQADASQAFGAGLTYAERYFLLKYFNIATPEEDPDAFRGKQRAAAEAEDATVAGAIIENFDQTIRAYLADHGDKTEEVRQFVAGYVKGGDYFKIKDSTTATNMLNGFLEKFVV